MPMYLQASGRVKSFRSCDSGGFLEQLLMMFFFCQILAKQGYSEAMTERVGLSFGLKRPKQGI